MTCHGEYKPQGELEDFVELLMTRGKGILCADEGYKSFKLMFQPIEVESTMENRRAWRELMFTTPSLGRYVSGVLLSPEALWQKTIYGVPFPELLLQSGILTGVTVDKTFARIPFSEEEWASIGLTDLEERLKSYYEAGARFTRWRCSFRANYEKKLPSLLAVRDNAAALARYASLVQSQRMVPLVEVELLPAGRELNLDRTSCLLTSLLAEVVKALQDYKAHLEGVILRLSPAWSIPTPGSTGPGPAEVALATYSALLNAVPPGLGGVCLLAGDHSLEEVAPVLDLLSRMDSRNPWPITFAISRPLQGPALIAWLGEEHNTVRAQKQLLKRIKQACDAVLGNYLKKKQIMESIQNQIFDLEQIRMKVGCP